MITNEHNIGLSVAVMLLNNNYDFDHRTNSISTTTLLKPLRALALETMHKSELSNDMDVTSLVASSTGSAVHDKLENTWLNPVKVKSGLAKLGFDHLNVVVNPTEPVVDKDAVVIYVEKRSEMPLFIDDVKFILTGKFDIVLEGKLEDLKNTIAFKVSKTLAEKDKYETLYDSMTPDNAIGVLDQIEEECPGMFDYAMQGSIYKLLNPDIITEDFMDIQFIIKDFKLWEVGKVNYPDVNPFQLSIDLFHPKLVLQWVTNKLTTLFSIIDTGVLPLCTDTELWRNPPIFKVYKDSKSKRALPKGTFDTDAEAVAFNNSRKVIGDVRMIPSVPKRCNYCNVRQVCEQYDTFVDTGLMERKL